MELLEANRLENAVLIILAREEGQTAGQHLSVAARSCPPLCCVPTTSAPMCLEQQSHRRPHGSDPSNGLGRWGGVGDVQVPTRGAWHQRLHLGGTITPAQSWMSQATKHPLTTPTPSLSATIGPRTQLSGGLTYYRPQAVNRRIEVLQHPRPLQQQGID